MYIALSLIFIFFYAIPKTYIDFKQLQYIQRKLQEKPIILNQEDFIKSGNYATAKLKLSIFSTFYETLLFLCWIGFGLVFLESQINFHSSLTKITSEVCFLMLFIIANSLLNLPLSYYTTMVLDKKFGFSNTNLKLFIIDNLKSLVLTIVFGSIISYVLLLLIANFQFWWFYGFLFVMVLVILINILYPTVFAPLFNKFTPLQDSNLQSKINQLLQDVGFESKGIFVMDASRRDGRLNAYFAGLGKSKRVILFDTLLQKVSNEGLLAILGHELGHFKHNDIFKNIIITSFLIFVIFLFSGIASTQILSQIGINDNNGAILILMFLLIPILSFWAMPFIGYFSRKAEYGADEFGSLLTSKSILANALVRIVNENKAFPHSHPLYVFFHYTHPPLLDRLKALEYEI